MSLINNANCFTCDKKLILIDKAAEIYHNDNEACFVCEECKLRIGNNDYIDDSYGCKHKLIRYN